MCRKSDSCAWYTCAEVDNGGASLSIRQASNAMLSSGQLLEERVAQELLPVGEKDQEKIVDIFTDGGQKLGTATPFFAGPNTKFHNCPVWPDSAVVGQLTITDQAAADSQRAWMGDSDQTQEGVTAISAIPAGAFIAVPLRCLRLQAEPPIMAAQRRHPGTSAAGRAGRSGASCCFLSSQADVEFATFIGFFTLFAPKHMLLLRRQDVPSSQI